MNSNPMYRKLNQVIIAALISGMLLSNCAWAAGFQPECLKTQSDVSTLAPRLMIPTEDIRAMLSFNEKKVNKNILNVINAVSKLKVVDGLNFLFGQFDSDTAEYKLAKYIVVYLQGLKRDVYDTEIELEQALSEPDAGSRIGELKQKLSENRKRVNEGLKRIETLGVLLKKYSLPKALKMINGGARRDLSSAQQFTVNILTEEMADYPDFNFNPQEILFIPKSSWLNELLNFNSLGSMISLSIEEQSCLIIISDEVVQEVELLNILLHEIVHKKLMFIKAKIRKENPWLEGFYHALEEVKADELSARMLQDFYLRNRSLSKAVNLYVLNRQGFFRNIFELTGDEQLPFEDIIYYIKSGYISELELRDALVRVFGAEVKAELDRFLYTGEYTRLKQLLGDKTWEALGYMPAEFFILENYSLKESALYFYTEIINNFPKDEIGMRLKQVTSFSYLARDMSHEVFYSWHGQYLTKLEFLSIFKQAKYKAAAEVFRAWKKDKTGKKELSYRSLFHQIILELRAMFDGPEFVLERKKQLRAKAQDMLQQSI